VVSPRCGGAPEKIGKVHGAHADAGGLQQFLAVAVVLNALGRAPTAPMRARRRPFTTRHWATKRARSLRNSGEAMGGLIFSQAEGYAELPQVVADEIFPQNASRRAPPKAVPVVGVRLNQHRTRSPPV